MFDQLFDFIWIFSHEFVNTPLCSRFQEISKVSEEKAKNKGYISLISNRI
jgi:hypothetical protein